MKELNPEKESPQKKVTSLAAVTLCLFTLGVGQARAQSSSGYTSTGSDSTPAPSIQITSPSNQSPYSGSVAQGTAKPEVVSLTFQDAIDLGAEEQPRRAAPELQHHRRPRTEVERAQRTSAQRYRESQRKCRAGEPGGSRSSISRISDRGRAFRILRCASLSQPVHPEP